MANSLFTMMTPAARVLPRDSAAGGRVRPMVHAKSTGCSKDRARAIGRVPTSRRAVARPACTCRCSPTSGGICYFLY